MKRAKINRLVNQRFDGLRQRERTLNKRERRSRLRINRRYNGSRPLALDGMDRIIDGCISGDFFPPKIINSISNQEEWETEFYKTLRRADFEEWEFDDRLNWRNAVLHFRRRSATFVYDLSATNQKNGVAGRTVHVTDEPAVLGRVVSLEASVMTFKTVLGHFLIPYEDRKELTRIVHTSECQHCLSRWRRTYQERWDNCKRRHNPHNNIQLVDWTLGVAV